MSDRMFSWIGRVLIVLAILDILVLVVALIRDAVTDGIAGGP